MSFVVIQFSIYLINSLNQTGFNHFDSSTNDLSNWFTLSLELGIGIPIAFVIGKHFFDKSVWKAFELFKRERDNKNLANVKNEGFMYGCFNRIDDTIRRNKLKEYFTTQNITSFLSPILINTIFFDRDKIIEDFDDHAKRLRSLSLLQSHDAAQFLEKIIKILKKAKLFERQPNKLSSFLQIEVSDIIRLASYLDLLIDKMKLQKMDAFEKHRVDYEHIQDRNYFDNIT